MTSNDWQEITTLDSRQWEIIQNELVKFGIPYKYDTADNGSVVISVRTYNIEEFNNNLNKILP